jgi:LmbE family N-acetylglucosaminyl deacetylase
MERAPLPEILTSPRAGRVLVFAPHPDDEVLGCGGALALHARQGDPIRVVVAFDGRRGDAGWSGSAQELVARRRAEAQEAGSCLGPLEYRFWGLPEGHEPAAEELQRGIDRARAEIAEFRPRTIYTPSPSEHHLDHHVLARVVEFALAAGDPAGCDPEEALSYEVWTPLVPDLVLDVTDVIEHKRAALERHRSQTGHTPLVHAALGLAAQRSLYLAAGSLFGEAFRRIPGARRGREAA